MRDWTDTQGYSSNDASHPRNRPAGAGAGDALAVDPVVQAQLVAGLRALAVSQGRPAPAAPADGRRGPAAGHQASLDERLRAFGEYRRVRDLRLAENPEMVVALTVGLAKPLPGRVCTWW